MTSLENINLIMHVTGTLEDFPKNMHVGDLERDMWAHVNSKYSNSFKITISNDLSLTDGIACLVNVGQKASVTFFELDKKYYKIPSLKGKYESTHTFDIGENDLIMFPTSIKYRIDGDGAKLLIFKINDRQQFGSGTNKYVVAVTFSDTYHITVNADSEEEAKDIAYDIDTSYWIHDWPKDKDLEKIQTTRISKWGKKNLEVIKL